MAQYLDLTGLSKYDELIKALINKADTDLGKRIDAVVEDCGENNSSLTEIVALIGNIEDGKTLAGLLSDLNKEDENLRKLISEIAGVDSDAGESIASMSEIVEQIKNLQEIIGQKYSEGSDAETIVNRLDDLEKDGEKYKKDNFEKGWWFGKTEYNSMINKWTMEVRRPYGNYNCGW